MYSQNNELNYVSLQIFEITSNQLKIILAKSLSPTISLIIHYGNYFRRHFHKYL